MDRTRYAARLAGVVTLLSALALPFVAVGVLRLYPPLPLDAAGGGLALAAISAGIVAVAAAVASVAHLAIGLGRGQPAALALAAGMAALAGSFGLEALGGVAGPDRSLGMAVAGLLVLLAAALARREAVLDGRGLRLAAALGLFAVVEAAVAGLALAPQLGAPLGDAARIVAGLAFLLSALDGRPRLAAGAALLAAGVALEALARPGSAELLVAHVAFAAGILAARLQPPAPPAKAARAAMEEPATDERRSGEPMSDEPPGRETDELAEAGRLGRELRATIEELMQARRTIELQRDELERAASIDPLTGVASRSAILERLRLESAEARRYAHSLAVLLIDVDGFTEINRTHGTEVGDGVLRELALRLRLRVREADALGRSAGDAFLAILPHTDEAGAVSFAEALRHRLGQRPIATEGDGLSVSVSVGVAFMRPGEELDADRLLARAEEALASAQATGGNVIAFDRLHGLARIDGRRQAPSVQGDTAQDSGA